MKNLIKDLNAAKNEKKAESLQRYFKTGKGEYGEGDSFLGLTVPEQRKIAHKHIDLSLGDLGKVLQSNIHEHRFTALEILVAKYKKATEKDRKEIINFYLANTDRINNWDLVDTSANILGDFLSNKDKALLHKLSKSTNLWERRIAIVSTFQLIKQGQFDETLKIAENLLGDKHDLIHKAVGWMLREVGKKDKSALEGFLKKHYKTMPRTMLRYAIEKFSEKERKLYLAK